MFSSFISCEYYCFRYNDWNVQTVLQVCIQPGSYRVSEKTIKETDIDPLFKDSELEWSTDTIGATSVYGILIRMEKI